MDQHDEPATVHVAPSRDFRLYVQQDHQPNNADPGKISNTNTTKTYIVSSAVMSLATPVWKILLDPEAQCKEATAEEAYLLDDDPDMLLILLRISHLHSTHYQQCSPSINCYIWQSSVTRYEEWLFMAWIFGDFVTLEKLAKQLAKSCRTNQSGHCITPSGKRSDGTMPPGIVRK
ncbi:MAG: hypothetical protein ASARMPRED_002116 [Alectoria sarmentosa]|nr:MAG: hypothetical protein ASARMPRED_002116 [Alectoria sarmentosa]